MSSILFKSKALADGYHPVMLRITYRRKRKYYSIEGLKARLSDWSEGDSRKAISGRFKGKEAPEKNGRLQKWEAKARDIVMKMDAQEIEFTFDRFERDFKNNSNTSVFEFIKGIIVELKEANRLGSANSYKDTLYRIQEYRNKKDFTFYDIDFTFLKKFEKYYLNKGTSGTTIGIYLRTLRAIYNRAIKEGKVNEVLYPFKDFKIKNSPPKQKRALSKEEIVALINYTAPLDSIKWHSLNYFKFSYLCRGMNLMDIVKLRWEKNINSDRIEYGRSKTGDVFSLKINSEIEKLLSYYQENRPYIFPVLEPGLTALTARYRQRKLLKLINKDLKEVASDLKIPRAKEISFYWARHTYATVLKRAGVATSLISEALGHSTEKVTQAYLDSFGKEQLDQMDEHLL